MNEIKKYLVLKKIRKYNGCAHFYNFRYPSYQLLEKFGIENNFGNREINKFWVYYDGEVVNRITIALRKIDPRINENP